MKRFGIIILLAAFMFQGFSQDMSAVGQNDEKERNVEPGSNREVVIGRNFLRIAENDTSVNVRIGNRELSILESLEGEGTHIRLEKYDEDDQDDHGWNDYSDDERGRRRDRLGDRWTGLELSDYSDDSHGRRRDRFRGHWTGFEIGFNNYTASRKNHLIPDDISYMTLHSGKSHNFNINFAQLNLGMIRHVGFVTGLGLNWNNYKFDSNNNIIKGVNGNIEILDPGEDLEKTKLSTIYLTIPFLLEFQLPVSNNHLNLAAGPIGAVKIGSHSKMVFEDRHKVKSNSDFNLNILRYGGTARFGYSNVELFATYYFTPLFRSGKGPGGYDLYPFEIGMAFTFNN